MVDESPKKKVDDAALRATNAIREVVEVPDDVLEILPKPVVNIYINTLEDLRNLQSSLHSFGESLPDPIEDAYDWSGGFDDDFFKKKLNKVRLEVS